MRSVLITGASGYFGRAFVRRLLAERVVTMPDFGNGNVEPQWCDEIGLLSPIVPERICIFSRCEHRQAAMRSEFGDDPRLRWFIGDVRDEARLKWAMAGVDGVVHAAALKRIEVGHYNPEEMVKTNINGTMNVVRAAINAAVPRVVLLSSDKAFEPVSPYGQSKAMAESLFLAANNTQYRTRFAVTRYGNVVGSTGSVIPTWRSFVARGEPVPVTDPTCTRFWMNVEEAVDLVLGTFKAMPKEPAIPALPAFRLGDLAAAMNASMKIVGLGAYEKRHESMRAGLSSDTAPRLTVDELRARLQGVA